jgi:ribose transport system permease protein
MPETREEPVEAPAGEPRGSASFLHWMGIGRPEDEGSKASFFERYSGVVLLIVMIIGFTIALPGEFLTYDNLIGVVSNQTIGGIMAIALLLPLAAGVFDVSIGGAFTLAVVLVTWLFQVTSGSMPIGVAIVITLIAGVVIGCLNGALVVGARIDPFIATIGTSSVFLGLSEVIANGTTISADIPDGFTSLGRTFVAKVPITLAYVAIVALVVWYVLEQTPFGRRIYATGASREAARLTGVRTKRVIFLCFVASGVLATLAGIVYAARIGAGAPDTGSAYLLPAFATAFLGSTMIRPGRFNVPGLIVAVFIVAIGINGLQLLGIPFWITDIYQGVVLVVAVSIARIRAR